MSSNKQDRFLPGLVLSYEPNWRAIDFVISTKTNDNTRYYVLSILCYSSCFYKLQVNEFNKESLTTRNTVIISQL
jgi:hypothetical protein